jgi:pyruvate kinase
VLKRTKIVATIGPASADRKVLTQLIKSGVNVARLNFSHGDHKSHAALIKKVRVISKELKTEVAIMQDLQGPRIRVGKVSETGINIAPQDKVVIAASKDLADMNMHSLAATVIPLDYQHIAEDVAKGDRILISDGLIHLVVQKVENKLVYTEAVKGGIILSHKGVNIPGIKIKEPVITEKDKKDLSFAISQQVDFVALSFVGDHKDIISLKKLIARQKPKNEIQVIAKIERMAAFKNYQGILKEADGLMVARGDLGIEIPQAKVPLVQKELITACLQAAKPVIVATQMLDSMINYPLPTRAEVSDVANAVIDGADAVMLSGETAFGKHPQEAVAMMSDIIIETEASPFQKSIHSYQDKNNSDVQAVADSVFHLAHNAKAKFIVPVTRSGFTARVISRYRPEIDILTMVVDPQVARHLQLTWGVTSYQIKECQTFVELIDVVEKRLLKEKKVRSGDKIILVSSQLTSQRHTMDLIKLHTIGQ